MVCFSPWLTLGANERRTYSCRLAQFIPEVTAQTTFGCVYDTGSTFGKMAGEITSNVVEFIETQQAQGAAPATPEIPGPPQLASAKSDSC
jgi:hypothetical protein